MDNTNIVTLEDVDLIQFAPQSLPINELGKQLLKAAADGNVDDIRALLSKGAPFTADWLGTSPLHLAAQNNHLKICEILLRAGMSRDARTKVDRTPLHIAAYEGNYEIAECLLKHGSEYDCQDLLQMTPLHWAAQNGHADIAALLIRYGAATHVTNKFDLTPAAIALQMQRHDIVQIINLAARDPLVATQHLALELNSDNSSECAVVEPILTLAEDEDSNAEIPIETVMMDDNAVSEAATTTNNFSESLKLLQQHGITMLPVDDNNILNSVMENGHSVVLTEAGKQALNSIKYEDEQLIEAEDQTSTIEATSPRPQPAPTLTKLNNRRIITLSADEFLAMTNGGTPSNQLFKVLNNNKQMKPQILKRVVVKKNQTNNTKLVQVTSKTETVDVNSLMERLHRMQLMLQSYKKRLAKAEYEAAKYKKQLRLVLNKVSDGLIHKA